MIKSQKYYTVQKYRWHTLLFCTLLLSLFSGCAKMHDYCPHKPKSESSSIESYVLVSAKLPYLRPDLRVEAGTIGSSELSDVTHKKGNFGESDVRRVRVIVANTNGVIVRNQLFDSTTGANAFSVAEIPATGSNLAYREITLKLKLAPDKYRFLIIANEPTDKTAALNGISKYISEARTITESINNLVYIPTDLNATSSDNNQTIPMIGMSATLISVPSAIPPSGTLDNPVPVSPEIPIERVLSKVEFYATNSDDNSTVYPGASKLHLTKVILKRTVGRYNLFPDDTTPLQANSYVMGALNSTGFISGRPTYTSAENSNMVWILNNEMTVDNNHITASYKKMTDGSPIFSYYMCERRDVSEDSSCVMEIYLGDNEDSSHEYVYTVKLGQKGASGSTVDYNIYRNRIYQVYATIKGGQQIKVRLLVRGWNPVSYSSDVYAADLVDSNQP